MSLTSNVMLGFPNIGGGAILSGGSWSTTLPLDNIKNGQIERVARSSNLLASSTQFDGQLGVGRRIRVFGIINHSMSTSATIRLRFSDGPVITVTTVNVSGNSVTLNFVSTPVPILVGSQITVDLNGGNNFDGTFTVTASTSTSVTYVATRTPTGTPNGGSFAINLDFDTGFIPVWQRAFDSINLAWQAGNFWTGRPLNGEIKSSITPNFIYCLPVEVFSKFLRVEIVDTANVNGYIDLGFLFISKGFQPRINMQEGASVGYQTNTEVEMSESGAEYFRRREPYRVARFTLNNQSPEDALGIIFDGQRTIGIDRNLIFIYNPFDQEDIQRRAFMGRLEELSPIDSIFVDRYSVGFQIKEIQ